jgi:hypothetical protein
MAQSLPIALTITDILAAFGRMPRYITGLDSATVVLQALAKYLHGKDLPPEGNFPKAKAIGGEMISQLPEPAIAHLSTWAGWWNASPQKVVNDVRAETMSRWVLSQYPRRRYPAAMIGSCNGAMTYLSAALGIPWLPQTLLVCLQHPTDPDQPHQAMEWAREPVKRLLYHNPDLKVYQLHDPNQDRVKVPRVIYFRLKRTRLGETYKQFLRENLQPGATLFTLDCQYKWLSTQVDDRHFFQFGGTGHLTPEDYFDHSPQIAEFLQRNHSTQQYWNPPAADGWFPESEWGYDPDLSQDIEQFAQENGFRVQKIEFYHPQDLSPMVAELYRWWYRERGMPDDRLFAQSFVYLQPWWTLRFGFVPFWTVFNDQTSANKLREYLDTSSPYASIYANLFSNGIHALGVAPIEQWRSILEQARDHGQFIGVDEQTYPGDLASFSKYYLDLKNLEAQQYPMPEPLTLQQLETFLAQTPDRYSVRWDNSATLPDAIASAK